VVVSRSDPQPSGQAPEDQPWTGDDQQWWDWYITTASNDRTDGDLQAGPVLPPVAPASAADVAVAMAEPYPLGREQVTAFRRDGFVKLPAVIPPDVIVALAGRLEELLVSEFGDDVTGRFRALEMMWRTDELMRSVALSTRLGGIAAGLLGESAVRLYHDNALSKQPGCGRTPWHHDADHFPLASAQICTAWFPLHELPAAMGPLAFAPGVDVDDLGELPVDPDGTSYDTEITDRLRRRGTKVEDGPFALGDVSYHSAGCLHTAGPNRTTAPRRALSNTYMADGIRVVAAPTRLAGTWREFLPGVAPGERAASAYNPVVGRA
jgi:hypothetical protein